MRSRCGIPILLLTLACSATPQQHAALDSLAATLPRDTFSFRTPAPGDTLVEGRSYLIRWVAVPARRINLGAVMGGKDKGFLLTNAPAGLDSLLWTVPIGFVTGFGPASSDQIRLRLENADKPSEWVETGRFVIVGR
ncbi:MAG: hypothetical protein V4558_13290 [Gemmatimonadota bacterium]